MEMWAIWLIIGVLLIIAEMATLTFYLLWLGVGALFAALAAWLFPDATGVQVLIGIVVAMGLTIYTRPLTRRVRQSKGFTDVIYQLVGQEGIVIEPIPIEGLGVVRVGNETWSAAADEPLVIGTPIIVVQSRNTTLQVQKRKDV
jgi:membrane protein implicated in regulation of membrane protease activity